MAITARLRNGNTTITATDVKIRTNGVTYTLSAGRQQPTKDFTLGWESTGDWTSMDLEDTFWAWVSTRTGVEVRTLGTTLEGRPIREAAIGAQDAPTLLLIGGVHGREPAGREVALMVLRDLATGEYPGLLEDHRIVVIPTANPDGRANNTRGESRDIDINRDMYRLETVEAESLTASIRDHQPVMLADLHQYNGDGVHHFWPQGNPRANTHPQIKALADQAVILSLDAVEGEGFASTPYPLARRGTVNEVATAHHCVGLLAESRAINFTRPDVIRILRTATDTWIAFFRENTTSLVSAREASLQHALTHPGPELVNLQDLDISEGNSYEIQISGYQLTGNLPAKHRNAFSIEVEDGLVPIQQKARGIIPELMDPDLNDPVAQAIRIGEEEVEPNLITNGLFRDSLAGWYEYGATSGGYQQVDQHDGRHGALYFDGTGPVRLETEMLLDHDGVSVNFTAEIWVAEDGMRPGQLQMSDLDAGGSIHTPISPAEGDLSAGWNTVHGSTSLGSQGRTRFGLRIAQINAAQQNPAYWRITEASISS